MNGNQIALGSNLEPVFLDRPATLTVSHCDIQGGQAGVFTEPGRTLNWEGGNKDVDPAFVLPYYYLSQTDAGEGAARMLRTLPLEITARARTAGPTSGRSIWVFTSRLMPGRLA